MKKNKKLIYFAILACLLVFFVVLDRYTKLLAVSSLKNSDNITLIRGFLGFTYLENRGAAWGMLSGKINILVLITIIIIPILIFIILRTERAKSLLSPDRERYLTLFQFDLVLILAGATGNLIDRLLNGFVVDFLQFLFIDFPVFNIADCYITVGAVLFIAIYLFFLKEEDTNAIFKRRIQDNDEVSH